MAALNLVKLSVGSDSVADLAAWQQARRRQLAAEGKPPDHYHRTRQMPRRRDDLLGGGSMFWVIKGIIQVRQRILDLREVRCEDGIRRCDIVLHEELIQTRPQPRRAFQGWRYLDSEDVPPDIGPWKGDDDDLSIKMRAELIELGLY